MSSYTQNDFISEFPDLCQTLSDQEIHKAHKSYVIQDKQLTKQANKIASLLRGASYTVPTTSRDTVIDQQTKTFLDNLLMNQKQQSNQISQLTEVVSTLLQSVKDLTSKVQEPIPHSRESEFHYPTPFHSRELTSHSWLGIDPYPVHLSTPMHDREEPPQEEPFAQDLSSPEQSPQQSTLSLTPIQSRRKLRRTKSNRYSILRPISPDPVTTSPSESETGSTPPHSDIAQDNLLEHEIESSTEFGSALSRSPSPEAQSDLRTRIDQLIHELNQNQTQSEDSTFDDPLLSYFITSDPSTRIGSFPVQVVQYIESWLLKEQLSYQITVQHILGEIDPKSPYIQEEVTPTTLDAITSPPQTSNSLMFSTAEQVNEYLESKFNESPSQYGDLPCYDNYLYFISMNQRRQNKAFRNADIILYSSLREKLTGDIAAEADSTEVTRV